MKYRYLWLLLLPGLVGCETLGFYQQAVWGQWRIMAERVPVDEALEDLATDEATRARLRLVSDMLSYAEDALQLPVEKRYQSYVQLDREYVVWNVFAADPLNLDAGFWCYPIVGCAPYRGYFDKARAERAAERLQKRGMEIYLGGVPAYSTLGWFDDPLLSSFLLWPEADLASLLFHELSHGRVWVPGDTAFNESFASFVGEEGARQWFAQGSRQQEWEDWRTRQRTWQAFRSFVLQAKSRLETIYATPASEAELLDLKAGAYQSIQACYEKHRERLGGGRYDELMATRFNNAFLVSVGTYLDWLPAFAEMFNQAGREWQQFYVKVDELAELEETERTAELERLAQKQKGDDADDGRADQINCETLASHRLNAEAAG